MDLPERERERAGVPSERGRKSANQPHSRAARLGPPALALPPLPLQLPGMLGLLRRCAALRRPAPPLASRCARLHSLGAVEGVHPPFANYSHGVVVGPDHETLFLSGQLGIDAEGNVPEGVAEQAELTFEGIRRLLAEAGMGPVHGAPPPPSPLPCRWRLRCRLTAAPCCAQWCGSGPS